MDRINQISKMRCVSNENNVLILSRINTIKHDEQDKRLPFPYVFLFILKILKIL